MSVFWLTMTVALVALLGAAVLFAGLAVYLRRKNERTAALWADLESRWEPILERYVNGRAAPGDFEVGNSERCYFVEFVQRRFVRAPLDKRQPLKNLVAPYIDLIAERAREGDAEQRARAVRTLGAFDFPRHQAMVESALDDPAPMVSMVAAASAPVARSPDLLRGLMRRIDSLAPWGTHFLAHVFVRSGSEIAGFLIETFRDETSSELQRVVAAEALELLRSENAAPVARAVLAQNPEPPVAAAALRLLAAVGEAGDLPIVRRYARSEEPILRTRAMEVIQEKGLSEDRDIMVRAVRDRNVWVALHAIWGLRRIKAENELLAIARSDDERAELARQVLQEMAA